MTGFPSSVLIPAKSLLDLRQEASDPARNRARKLNFINFIML
jgi:hypothetical protein